MHIPDGFLSFIVAILLWALAIIPVGYALRRVGRDMNERKVPLMGVLAAARRGTGWDAGAMGFSLLGVSIPNFWLGPLLVMLFSLALGWFPVSGRSGPLSLVLPAITLGTAMASILSRMVRATLLGLQLGALLAGAVITEAVFSWPGIGQLVIEAIQRRDYPVVQACVLLISLAYVLVNTLTDLVYAWVDPRIRLG
jgi:peptide/nickel transport system permease protein